MVYRFVRETENRSVLDFHFYLKDAGLYLFKTGICFYVYEAIFSDDFTNNVDLSLDELVVFQNRIKELNVLRGFQSKGLNYYGIYPYDAGRNNNTEKIEFYTQAQVIANDLKSIFGEVYYFPPRVNEIIKMNKKAEIQKKWDNKRKEFGIKGITSDQKKYIKY